jgi:murein hydrolase activator
MAGMLSVSKTIFKVTLFIVAAIFICPQIPVVSGAKSDEIGIVSANRLNLRPNPGIKSPPLITIEKGTKLRILEHHKKWLKIEHNGHIGYIRNLRQFIRILPKNGKEKTDDMKNSVTGIDGFKKSAEGINRKIKRGNAELLNFKKQEASIVNRLNDIDLSLDSARKIVVSLKAELPALEGNIDKTQNASKTLEKKIDALEGYASQRLVALYKLNRLSRIYILASAQSMVELFQRKKALEKVLSYDEAILEKLLENKNRLQDLLIRLNTQRKKKHSVEVHLKEQIVMMSRERSKRSDLLQDIRKKKSLKIAALKSLKQAAADLDQTIYSLNFATDRTFKEKNTASKPFSALKGLLNMPVKGKIVSFFGTHNRAALNVTNFQSGIEIKADRGEPIRAFYDGKVLYAKWFKGYGNMLIIDHGNNYYTVYAHAQELFMAKGDLVEQGEVVATVGDSGSMSGPSLHFEVRHHGKPLNPIKWLKKG